LFHGFLAPRPLDRPLEHRPGGPPPYCHPYSIVGIRICGNQFYSQIWIAEHSSLGPKHETPRGRGNGAIFLVPFPLPPVTRDGLAVLAIDAVLYSVGIVGFLAKRRSCQSFIVQQHRCYKLQHSTATPGVLLSWVHDFRSDKESGASQKMRRDSQKIHHCDTEFSTIVDTFDDAMSQRMRTPPRCHRLSTTRALPPLFLPQRFVVSIRDLLSFHDDISQTLRGHY